MKLAISKGYPWRASLSRKARCSACVNYIEHSGFGISCSEENKIQYPTYSKTHGCPDFKFKPQEEFTGPRNEFEYIPYPECFGCGHNFKGACSGKQWLPVKIVDDKCEFYRDKKLICRNAIPYLQYCNNLRNNYCKLPPHKRDSNRGWGCNCPSAHYPGIEHKKCYKSKGRQA